MNTLKNIIIKSKNGYFVLIAFGLLNFKTTYSQNYVDLLKLTTKTTSPNTFDSSSSSTMIEEIGADLTVPIKINDSAAIISGLIYESIRTKLFENQSATTFSSITLKFGINKKFGEKWNGTFIVLPKISSNFKKLGKSDYQVGGIALFKYTKNENLNYKFGLYYNSELFGPFFVPMVGLYYLSPNKKTEVNLMLPLQANFDYKLIPFIHIGANYNGLIRSYHLVDVAPQNYNSYLGKSSNELSAYLKFNFTNSLSLQTNIGYSIGRNYRVYNENDKVSMGFPAFYLNDKRKQLNTDFADGIVYQITLLYRVHM